MGFTLTQVYQAMLAADGIPFDRAADDLGILTIFKNSSTALVIGVMEPDQYARGSMSTRSNLRGLHGCDADLLPSSRSRQIFSRAG